MEQDKVEAVKRMQPPKTKKDMRTFLGLTGYYRRFIPNYASIAAPLTDLTRKHQPNLVQWTPDAEASCSCQGAGNNFPYTSSPQPQKGGG